MYKTHFASAEQKTWLRNLNFRPYLWNEIGSMALNDMFDYEEVHVKSFYSWVVCLKSMN